MRLITTRTAMIAAAASAGLAVLVLAGPASAASAAGAGKSTGAAGFQSRVILNGQELQHTFVPAGSTTPQTESLSSPDDITLFDQNLPK